MIYVHNVVSRALAEGLTWHIPLWGVTMHGPQKVMEFTFYIILFRAHQKQLICETDKELIFCKRLNTMRKNHKTMFYTL